MNLKDTYNKIARDWFKDHNDDTWWIERTDKLISLLPPHAKVLDIGCGAGHKSAYFAGKGFEVVGGDFSEEMIKIAREQVPGAEFKVLDLYELDTLTEKFDCVFAQAVFLHIPKKDVLGIFRKVKEILREGGLFYIAVKEAREGSPDEAVLTENGYGYEYQRFFSYFSAAEIHEYLSEAGFEVVDSGVTDVGHTRWVQVIAKL
ncbi:MAG TPA: class I SAM-dependent methyltransferase [Candidatus Paceibacterota bacterium]|nr:class I SAM-dependent methyltransferase [Candidatus Paceibacterota bacterium]